MTTQVKIIIMEKIVHVLIFKATEGKLYDERGGRKIYFYVEKQHVYVIYIAFKSYKEDTYIIQV